MAHSKTIARPYAKAVFAQANTQDAQQSWREFLQVGAQMMQDSFVQSHLNLPEFTQQLTAWLDQWMVEKRQSALSKEEKNFLAILAEQNRLAVLPEIADFYEQLMHAKQNVCKVNVRSAQPLKEDERQSLKKTLTQKIGRQVQLDVSEQADLLAGVIIEYEGQVIDQTLKGRLNRLARSLD